MKDLRVDAFRGQLDRDAIAVEFGHAESAAATGGPSAIALFQRVAMPPATAKRLVLVLSESLRALPPAVLSMESDRRGDVPRNAPPDECGEKGALLLQLVGEMGVPFQHERSFQLAQGQLAANRFLLSLNAVDIPGSALERVLGICERLGMPAHLKQAASGDFVHAACVHFGFESSEGAAIAKVYFERAIAPADAQAARERAIPVLLHRAFKWDIRDTESGTAVITDYRWHPQLDHAAICERLERVYGDGHPSLSIARGVVALAAERAPGANLQYLEVAEANGRRSFDLNVYDAKLRVSDAQPLLDAMRARCDVRPGRFQALYDQISTRALGHVAGGTHRNGKEFFNVYYGVTGYPLFNQRFR